MFLLPSYLENPSQTPARQVGLSVIVLSSILFCGIPTLANNNEQFILIESQAVGSFLDNDEKNVQRVESNVVDGVELEGRDTTSPSAQANLNHNQTKDSSGETVQ